jgi:hypothetical protein
MVIVAGKETVDANRAKADDQSHEGGAAVADDAQR